MDWSDKVLSFLPLASVSPLPGNPIIDLLTIDHLAQLVDYGALASLQLGAEIDFELSKWGQGGDPPQTKSNQQSVCIPVMK